MAETRRRGYAVDRGEDNELLTCAAAPVYDRRNAPVAAISVSMVRAAADEAALRRAGACVQAGAAELSRRLGSTRTRMDETELCER